MATTQRACAQRSSRFATVALAIATLLAAPAAAQMPPNPPVEVAAPLPAAVIDYDVYTGRFEAIERVELRARVSGYLETVGFEDGAIVDKGQTLFTIDRRPFEAIVARAEAALASAIAGRDLARIELDRATQLADRNVGTIQEVDRTRATLGQAEAEVAVAEAELRAAQLDLAFTEIRAPFRGRISAREIDPGNLIVGGTTQATLLATLVQIEPIHFIFTASEADYLRYARLAQTGTRPSSRENANPVSVRLMDEDDFRHDGVMEFVDNELDPNSGTIVGRALIENVDTKIVPGMFGRLRLPASGEYQALLIPDEAVLSDQARKIVMVVDGEGTVSPRPVTLGDTYRGLRVVREGLSPEDRVVVNGVQRARPGGSVTANEVTLEFRGE